MYRDYSVVNWCIWICESISTLFSPRSYIHCVCTLAQVSMLMSYVFPLEWRQQQSFSNKSLHLLSVTDPFTHLATTTIGCTPRCHETMYTYTSHNEHPQHNTTQRTELRSLHSRSYQTRRRGQQSKNLNVTNVATSVTVPLQTGISLQGSAFASQGPHNTFQTYSPFYRVSDIPHASLLSLSCCDIW